MCLKNLRCSDDDVSALFKIHSLGCDVGGFYSLLSRWGRRGAIAGRVLRGDHHERARIGVLSPLVLTRSVRSTLVTPVRPASGGWSARFRMRPRCEEPLQALANQRGIVAIPVQEKITLPMSNG